MPVRDISPILRWKGDASANAPYLGIQLDIVTQALTLHFSNYTNYHV